VSRIKVGALTEFAHGTATKVDAAGTAVALVNIDGSLYAIADRCSHANISLAEGEVHCATKELECWKHGSAFSLVTGQPNTLPATQPVAVYDVTVEGDDVYVTPKS
jgi:3-phenylpropionate/trans-cinnamate dioxygenase ferredoxin subunit